MGLEPADRDLPDDEHAADDPSAGEWTDDRGQVYGRNQVPAAVPCPDWCDSTPGGPADGQCDRYLRTATGHLVRIHRARIGQDTGTGVEVWITAVERAASATGPVEIDAPQAQPRVGVEPSGGCPSDQEPPHLSTDELRAAASTLLRAADHLDGLNHGEE